MARFLIVRFSSIGDIVLTTPVIRCLKQQVPDAEIHFLTKSTFGDILIANPYVDQVHTFDGKWKPLIAQLKSLGLDYIIDLHHNLRSRKVKQKLGAKSYSFRKLNFQKWLLVNFKIDRLPAIHIVDRYLETVHSLGVVNDGKGLDYFIPPEKEISIIDWLPSTFHQGYYVAIIGAGHYTKQMPHNLLCNVIEQLELPVVLIGDSGDHHKAAIIAQKFPDKTFNACGRLSIHGSASIIKQSVSVIAPDTGMMHIAAALGKPLASVWGNTVPAFGMGPYFSDEVRKKVPHEHFEVNGLSCRPCSKIGYARCPRGHFKCMEEQSDKSISNFTNRANL